MPNLVVVFHKFANELKISLMTVESSVKCYMANRSGKRKQFGTVGP